MALLLFLVACTQPLHLQYDFGRSYMDVAEIQANLDRPSAANAVYELSGAEGILLRENVVKETTEEKTGTAEKTESK
jgi:hypothetical protein